MAFNIIRSIAIQDNGIVGGSRDWTADGSEKRCQSTREYGAMLELSNIW